MYHTTPSDLDNQWICTNKALIIPPAPMSISYGYKYIHKHSLDQPFGSTIHKFILTFTNQFLKCEDGLERNYTFSFLLSIEQKGLAARPGSVAQLVRVLF